MKYVYLTLNWLFGGIFVLSGFAYLTTTVLGALCNFAMAALLLPPVRQFVFSKTGKELPVKFRAVALLVLFGASGYFMTSSASLEAEKAASKKESKAVELAAQTKKKNIDFFNENREKIVSSTQAAFATKDYATVISESKKYLVAGDQELKQLHDEAKSALADIKKAEAAKKEEARREKRTTEILAELKTVPASEYSKNQKLYGELFKYHPYQASYKERLDFYSGKVKEQKEKSRKAQEIAEKALADQLAKFGKAPTQSGWDGSYLPVKRYLESIANDPDSIDITACTEVYNTKDGWLVGCDYRGKNAFGALIKQSNWFIIVHDTVIAMKDASAYSP